MKQETAPRSYSIQELLDEAYQTNDETPRGFDDLWSLALRIHYKLENLSDASRLDPAINPFASEVLKSEEPLWVEHTTNCCQCETEVTVQKMSDRLDWPEICDTCFTQMSKELR